MSQSIQDGKTFDYTAPTGGITNGRLVVVNRMAGVALNTVAAGSKVALALEGVFSLAAVATGAKTQGNRVFYRTTGSQLKCAFASGVATGAKYTIGTVWETATAASTSVKVKLVGGPLAAI